jgi:hypothetical protein
VLVLVTGTRARSVIVAVIVSVSVSDPVIVAALGNGNEAVSVIGAVSDGAPGGWAR